MSFYYKTHCKHSPCYDMQTWSSQADTQSAMAQILLVQNSTFSTNQINVWKNATTRRHYWRVFSRYSEGDVASTMQRQTLMMIKQITCRHSSVEQHTCLRDDTTSPWQRYSSDTLQPQQRRLALRWTTPAEEDRCRRHDQQHGAVGQQLYRTGPGRWSPMVTTPTAQPHTGQLLSQSRRHIHRLPSCGAAPPVLLHCGVARCLRSAAIGARNAVGAGSVTTW